MTESTLFDEWVLSSSDKTFHEWLEVRQAQDEALLAEKFAEEERKRTLALAEEHERLEVRAIVLAKLKALPAWCFDPVGGTWHDPSTGASSTLEEMIKSESATRRWSRR